MFRVLTKTSPSLLLWPGFSCDKKIDVSSTTDEVELDPGRIEYDRFKKIFELNENGSYSQELQRIISAACTGFLGGSAVGGLLASARSPDKYKEGSAIVKYETRYQAARALQHKVVQDFLKGSMAIGLKTCFFMTMFQSIATILFTYNGEMSAQDYIIAGGITGATYKFPSGPRAAISGAVVGSTLGAFGAFITEILLFASGRKMSDVYNARALYLKEIQIQPGLPLESDDNPTATLETLVDEPTEQANKA